LTFLLIVITAILVLYTGYIHKTLMHAIAYLAVMWICSLFVDIYAIKRHAKNDFKVDNPKKETIYFFICFLAGLLFLYIRFIWVIDWQHLKPIIKLGIIPLFIFVFPIALAIIMLLLKYKPTDLGMRLQGLIIVIPIIAISAISNRIVSP